MPKSQLRPSEVHAPSSIEDPKARLAWERAYRRAFRDYGHKNQAQRIAWAAIQAADVIQSADAKDLESESEAEPMKDLKQAS